MTHTHEPLTAAPADKPRRRWAFLLRPGWIGVILAALAFAAASFLVLSPWQFDRNSERTAQNNAIEASINAPAVPVTDLLSASAQPSSDIAWRVVTATGEFDPTRQIYVRLRQDSAGQPVSEVIVPFRLTSGETVVVDRGYVSFADVRSGVSIPALPVGEVTITGRVQQEQVDPSNRPPVLVDGRTEAYAISSDSIVAGATVSGVTASGATESGATESGNAAPGATDGTAPADEFLQGYVQLTADSPGVLTPIEVPQTDSGPFLSYALQWAAFGVIALIGLGVFIYREAFVPRDDDPDQQAAAAQPTEPDRRRRSRDGFDRSQLYDD